MRTDFFNELLLPEQFQKHSAGVRVTAPHFLAINWKNHDNVTVCFITDLGQVLLQVYFLSLRVMHIVDPAIMSSRKRFAISANVECVFMDMVY